MATRGLYLARSLAQSALILAGVAVYPYMVILEGSVIAAPLLSGSLLALASMVGVRYICPVRWGILPGILTLALLATARPESLAPIASNVIALLFFTLYHLVTPAAIGGAVLLAYWNITRILPVKVIRTSS